MNSPKVPNIDSVLWVTVYGHIFGRDCFTRTPTVSERMALWLLWLCLWTLLCIWSNTLTYHLDASLDGWLDGRLSLLWPTQQSMYMPMSSDVVVACTLTASLWTAPSHSSHTWSSLQTPLHSVMSLHMVVACIHGTHWAGQCSHNHVQWCSPMVVTVIGSW